MDRQAVLAAFDEQIRRHPTAEAPGERVERDGAVVRLVAGEGGRSVVTWSQLAEATADAVIAATVDRFARLGVGEWEWKHYCHDRPADLARRLLAAGFTDEPAEALMVAEIAELALDVPPPAGVHLRPVTDPLGVDALVRVHDEVFGEDHSALRRELLFRLARRPPTLAAVVAVAGDIPICAGRVEFHAGTEFASLWGGGTLRAWRGRGVFRSLVAYRAALAAARGFRYLQVDASPESRPILTRLGFVELATTTPFIHPGTPT
jgi:GNAT superfamily N-acetyltransferase